MPVVAVDDELVFEEVDEGAEVERVAEVVCVVVGRELGWGGYPGWESGVEGVEVEGGGEEVGGCEEVREGIGGVGGGG